MFSFSLHIFKNNSPRAQGGGVIFKMYTPDLISKIRVRAGTFGTRMVKLLRSLLRHHFFSYQEGKFKFPTFELNWISTTYSKKLLT